MEVSKLLDDSIRVWWADDGSIMAQRSVVMRPDPMRYMLPHMLPASTTIREVKEVIEDEFKIPVSVQHHFACRPDYFDGRQPLLEFPDETTLAQVMEKDTSAQETGKLELSMTTTAGHIAAMDPGQTLKPLRKNWSRQKYLNSKLSRASNELSDDVVVSQWAKQLEEEKARGEKLATDLLQDILDWALIADGKADEVQKNVCLDIEKLYYKWAKRQNEYLQAEFGTMYGKPTPTLLSKQTPPPQQKEGFENMKDQELEYHFLVSEEGVD